MKPWDKILNMVSEFYRFQYNNNHFVNISILGMTHNKKEDTIGISGLLNRRLVIENLSKLDSTLAIDIVKLNK